mgnify:FL=1
MKLTKETLKRIIREELNNVMYTSDTAAQLGDFEDDANEAMTELEKNSYSIDGFEEKAIEAHKAQPSEETVYFDFETYTDGTGVEPQQATFAVTLTKDGNYTLDRKA